MALAQLLEALERNAREEAERVLAAARAAATRAAAESEAGVARRHAEALAARERELRAAAETRLAEARREGRRRVLEARDATLERVRAAARERLPEAEREPAALAARVHAALACLEGRDVEARCAPALAPAVRGLIDGRAAVRVAEDGTGALVIGTTDGAVEVDASLAGLLERRWPELAIDLVRALEEQP